MTPSIDGSPPQKELFPEREDHVSVASSTPGTPSFTSGAETPKSCPEKTGPSGTSACTICGKELTATQIATCQKDKVKLMCEEDRSGYRALMQQAREQGPARAQQVETLRRTDPQAFGLLVMEFREQCCKEAGSGRGRKKPQFDFATYFTNVEKGKRTATGGYQVLKVFADYVKHYQSLPFPLTLSLEQATRRWHAELDDPKHPKDKIKSPDENGLPNGPLVTRLAVTLHDYVDTSKFHQESRVFQEGQRQDRPNTSQAQELQEAFKRSSVLVEDDPLLDLPELPAHQLFSRSGTDEPQTKETKGNKGLGQSGQGSGKPPAKPPKIRNLRVLVEKSRINTSVKMENMDGSIKTSIHQCLAESLELMECPDGIRMSDLNLDSSVLQSCPLLTLKLRWFIAAHVFGYALPKDCGVPLDEILKCIDADPFLSQQEEIRKPQALVTLRDVVSDREKWFNCKTEAELKAAVEAHNIHMRSLLKVQQCLFSVQKDFKSEAQELKKAKTVADQKQKKAQESERKKQQRQEAAAEKKRKAEAEKEATAAGDKKRSRTKLNEVDESDFKVLQSMNGFSAARRIKVINLDAATTKENVLSTAAKEFRTGMPFILRPKRGKGFFKIMDVPKPSIEQLNLDVSQFVELLAQDGGTRTRLSGVLDATNEAATIPQALRLGTDEGSTWVSEDPDAAQEFGFFSRDDLCNLLKEVHNRTRPLTGPEIQIREKIATDALQMLAAGLIQGSSYCGIEANLLGSLRLQHTGGRLLAMARPPEVSEFIESKELPRVLDWLKTVTPDTLPAESVPTFAVGQVLMGDLLFTPLAYYFVEKAVNANSISLKVPVQIFTGACLESFMVMKDVVPSRPVIEALALMMGRTKIVAAEPMAVEGDVGEMADDGDDEADEAFGGHPSASPTVDASMPPPSTLPVKKPVKSEQEAKEVTEKPLQVKMEQSAELPMPVEPAEVEKPGGELQPPEKSAELENSEAELQPSEKPGGELQPPEESAELEKSEAELQPSEKSGKELQPPGKSAELEKSEAELQPCEKSGELQPPEKSPELEKSEAELQPSEKPGGELQPPEEPAELEKSEAELQPSEKSGKELQPPGKSAELEKSEAELQPSEKPGGELQPPEKSAELEKADADAKRKTDDNFVQDENEKKQKILKVDEADLRKTFSKMNLKGSTGLHNHLKSMSLSSEEMAHALRLKKDDIVSQLVQWTVEQSKCRSISTMFGTKS